MTMRFDGSGTRRLLGAALCCLALAGTARAQGDGPHNLPLIPKGTNLFVVLPLGLSGNFNPSQTILVPGATVDVFAAPLTCVRTFSLGGRFGRLFLTVSRGRSGWMDPLVTMHIGLKGAPALAHDRARAQAKVQNVDRSSVQRDYQARERGAQRERTQQQVPRSAPASRPARPSGGGGRRR